MPLGAASAAHESARLRQRRRRRSRRVCPERCRFGCRRNGTADSAELLGHRLLRLSDALVATSRLASAVVPDLDVARHHRLDADRAPSIPSTAVPAAATTNGAGVRSPKGRTSSDQPNGVAHRSHCSPSLVLAMARTRNAPTTTPPDVSAAARRVGSTWAATPRTRRTRSHRWRPMPPQPTDRPDLSVAGGGHGDGQPLLLLWLR